MPSFVSLAEELLTQAKIIDALLERNRIPFPSFDHDTLEALPEDAQKVRRELADTSHTIRQLARGARLSGLDVAFSWIDQVILRVVWHYNLASAIPLAGHATYDQISAASGLDRSLVVRTIRAAIPLNIFEELGPDEVCHTAISRLLVEDEGYRSIIGLQVEDLGPASTRLIEAWERAGGDAGEPDQSAFGLSHGGRSLFAVMSEDPQAANRFNLAMEYGVKDKDLNSFDVTKAFDWDGFDHPGSFLIDLGGGYGHVSQTLARHTKNLRFVVQDLPHVIEKGKQRLSPGLKDRISFAAQDFLQIQTSENPPNAFVISRCLHNWSDHHCTMILRALIPALRHGSKVLIWDVVLEDEPVRKFSERFHLQQDFIMATVSNGRDRSLADFKRLLDLSDKRFKLNSLRRLDSCSLAMLEVTWETA